MVLVMVMGMVVMVVMVNSRIILVMMGMLDMVVILRLLLMGLSCILC